MLSPQGMSSSAGCSTRPRSPRWRPVSAAAVRTISRVRWRSWPRANGCRLSCAGAPRAPCHLPDILLMCDHDNARRTSKSLMCMLVKGVCVSVGVAARRTSSALTAWHVQVLLLWQLLLGGGGRSGRRAVAAPATRCADKCTPPCRYTKPQLRNCLMPATVESIDSLCGGHDVQVRPARRRRWLAVGMLECRTNTSCTPRGLRHSPR